MIYIYDILLNFCDSNLVYDFYEWNNSDNIENIKRIKLIHVDSNLLYDMYTCSGRVDRDFLIKIFKTCEVYDSKRVKVIDYSILISDGSVVIAFEFDKDGNIIYKSRLLIDEEDEIATLASNLELYNLSFKKNKKILYNRFFTRDQLFIRKYLLKEIEDSYSKKDYLKLKYLYQEYFDKECSSNKKIFDSLVDSLNDINDKHIRLFNMIKLTKKKQV